MPQKETQSGDPYDCIVLWPFPDRSASFSHQENEPLCLFDSWVRYQDVYFSDFVVIEPPRSAAPCGDLCKATLVSEELIDPEALGEPFEPCGTVTFLVAGRPQFPEPDWEL